MILLHLMKNLNLMMEKFVNNNKNYIWKILQQLLIWHKIVDLFYKERLIWLNVLMNTNIYIFLLSQVKIINAINDIKK